MSQGSGALRASQMKNRQVRMPNKMPGDLLLDVIAVPITVPAGAALVCRAFPAIVVR